MLWLPINQARRWPEFSSFVPLLSNGHDIAYLLPLEMQISFWTPI